MRSILRRNVTSKNYQKYEITLKANQTKKNRLFFTQKQVSIENVLKVNKGNNSFKNSLIKLL
jgi:hypothetical protein